MSTLIWSLPPVDSTIYHTKRNKGKRLAYWIGFLEGALASGRIERLEPEALEAEASHFSAFFNDPGANDLVEDLRAFRFGDQDDLLNQIQTIVEHKRRELAEGGWIDDAAQDVSVFLGFCAGVICDGRVLEKEVRAIHDRFRRSGALRYNPVLRGFHKAINAVMEDGVVTEEEALEVQEWLAKLVGDGYADTGIPNIGNVTVLADMVRDPFDVRIEGEHIVLTGPMRMGVRSFIQEEIARTGGINEERITRRTTTIVVSENASPAWYATHFGRKIEAAHALLEEGLPIRFVSESAFERALALALASHQPEHDSPEPLPAVSEPVGQVQPAGFVEAAVELCAGQNIGVATALSTLLVSWKGGHGVDGLDAIVFVLGPDGKVVSDEAMVFFNQPVWQGGAVRLTSAGCGVHVDLDRMPASVDRVVLTGVPQSVADQPFSVFDEVYTTLHQVGGVSAAFALQNRGAESAMILAELYRRNGTWKMRAVGQGFWAGLRALAESYGVSVADETVVEEKVPEMAPSVTPDAVSGADPLVSSAVSAAEVVPIPIGPGDDPTVLPELDQDESLSHHGDDAFGCASAPEEAEKALAFEGQSAVAPKLKLVEVESIIADVSPPLVDEADIPGPRVFPPAFRQALNEMAARPQDALEDAETIAWAEEMQSRIAGALRDFAMEPRPADPPFRLIPNGVLINFRGHADLTLPKVYKRETEFYTTYGINVVDIRPGAGFLSFFVEREKRARISMAQAWLSANWADTRPGVCTNLFVGVREDNGNALFLNLDGEHEGYEEHAPHTLIAGETKSGKGVLTQSLLLQIIALNSPKEAHITIVDPKKGVDYGWIAEAPHLTGPIITTREASGHALKSLVAEMERRYAILQRAGSPNLTHYNRNARPEDRLPRLYFVHDEIGGWMAESKGYAEVVSGSAARLGMEGRAAGIHLVLITQRPDVQAVPGNLRDQLGNRLCLRVQRSDGSKMILNAQGGERLLGRGHIAAAFPGERPPGNAAFYVGQVPFAEPEDFALLGKAAVAHWLSQT